MVPYRRRRTFRPKRISCPNRTHQRPFQDFKRQIYRAPGYRKPTRRGSLYRTGSRHRRPAQICDRHHHTGLRSIKGIRAQKGISFDSIEDLVENNEIRKFIAERIDKLQKGFAGFEKIKRFTLLPKEFTIENGELTNTLKIRRPAINSHYASQIEAMYC